MNASETSKVKYHKKSQSVDFKKLQVLSNVDKFRLINNKNNNINATNNKNNQTNYNKTSINFNKSKAFGNTTNKDFYKSFRSTNSNFYLNEFQRRFKLENPQMPFESYRDSTVDIMSEYHYEALSKKPLDVSDKRLFIGDEHFHKIRNNLSRKSFMSDLEPISSEAKMKICVNQEDYKSPIKAFSVIFKNKVIHENVCKNNYSRQKNKYDEFLHKVNEFEKLTNGKFRKIKITSILPNKNDENFSFKSSNDKVTGTPTDNISLNINSPFSNFFTNFYQAKFINVI